MKDFQITTATIIGLLLVACVSFIDRSVAIRCFSCAVTTEIVTMQDQKMITLSCSHFDGSSDYIVDCPYSTMCSRIISTIYLQNGLEQRTITLGCANQKSSEHVLTNGRWNEEVSVKEIYPEDCKTINNNNLVGATKTYCHCRGNLCNSANRNNISFKVFFLLIPFLISFCI